MSPCRNQILCLITKAYLGRLSTGHDHCWDYDGEIWNSTPGNLTPDQKKLWDAAYIRRMRLWKSQPEWKGLVRWKYQRYGKDYLRCSIRWWRSRTHTFLASWTGREYHRDLLFRPRVLLGGTWMVDSAGCMRNPCTLPCSFAGPAWSNRKQKWRHCFPDWFCWYFAIWQKLKSPSLHGASLLPF